MELNNDPIGQAILDFSKTKKSSDIIVSSDLCDDDVISSAHLFRSFDEMPELEKIALKHCHGKVLDVGAGAGCHSKVLKENGVDVIALEPSLGAVSYINTIDIPVISETIQEHKGATYDTLLLLMNGVGLAGNLNNLDSFLVHLKSLLNTNGSIICDSTDVQYLYQEDDGSMWMDITADYYGDFKFQMKYGDHQTEWFEWLYIDVERLRAVATKVGFEMELLFEENDHYLVKLIVKTNEKS